MAAQHGSYFILDVLKFILIILLKIAALALAFACKLTGFVLEKISELLEKMVHNGAGHS